MGPKISVSMHDLAWPFPPLKLSLRNENDAYGNMHHMMLGVFMAWLRFTEDLFETSAPSCPL